jgi:HSP20 family protein
MGMSPFRRGRGFYDLHSEMNRLFDETYGGLPRQGQQRAQQLTEWAPAVDVLQRDGDLVVRAELPGVRPEDVDITLENRVLAISGERREEQEEQRGGYYVRERRHGSFRRSMTLPEGVDEDRVRARYDNGVLEVTIEGAAAAREPRRIQVESGESRAGTEGPGARTEVSTSADTTRPVAPGAAPEPRDVPPRTAGIEEGASPPRTEEAPPRREEEREGARRQPEREREEDKGLLDKARDALLGEEEEPRRREGTDRPEERR